MRGKSLPAAGRLLPHCTCVLALVVLLIGTGCGDESTTMPVPEPNDAMEITYLALGDSYTVGTGVSSTETWPRQLADAINGTTDFQIDAPVIVARNGWRTDDLQRGIATVDLQDDYDLVSLLIGVNDQFQGFEVAGYRTRFEELLNTAIALAGDDADRVFVVSIPDYSFTPFGAARSPVTDEIMTFNAAAAEVAERYGVRYLNITPISQEGLDMPDLVSADDLHPSGRQYGRWVSEVLLAPVTDLIGN